MIQLKNATRKNTDPRFAIAKLRIRKSPRSKSGSGCTSERRKKVTSIKTPATKALNVRGDVHPQLPPCTKPNNKTPIPNEASGTLNKSTFSLTSAPVLSLSHFRPATSANKATGTLIRNTARHPNPSISNAPREGANAAAKPLTAPQTPIARIRRSIGNAESSNANPAGYCAAPPID